MSEIPAGDADDRHDRFDRLRAEQPVFRDEANRTFILTRMADARAWLNDAAQWRDADRAEPGAYVHAFKPPDMNRPGDRNSGMGWMDEPDHSRVRGPIQLAMSRRVQALAPEVRGIVEAQLAELPAEGFDVLADYALPIPIAVMGRLLGVDTAEVARFRSLSEAALSVFDIGADADARRATKTTSDEIDDLLDEVMARRRAAPADDLISDLLAAQTAGKSLSDSEIRVNCMNLLLGGNVTTADLIATGVDLLLRHPAQLARLRASPALIGAAIEEILRFEPPTNGTQRVASGDVEIGGFPVRQGQVAAVMIAAANRDPTVFPDPHSFDIRRRGASHIAFGGGPHLCIGAALARLEARIAIQALLDRFPGLALADPHAPQRWRPNAAFHGLTSVLVRG
ncbi:MAG: cytochrome P450 [Caulobacteraceae bacterium]|nr:cytochrome P450 [Caulobacteraceae bacterium]